MAGAILCGIFAQGAKGKKEDLSKDAIKALEILRHWNDDEKHFGPPAPETELAEELVKHSLIERDTRPITNSPDRQAVVGHFITERGRKLLEGEEV